MARWSLTLSADGSLELVYRRSELPGAFVAGSLHPSTPTSLILSWVTDQAVTECGDMVVLPDGEVLLLLPLDRGVN